MRSTGAVVAKGEFRFSFFPDRVLSLYTFLLFVCAFQCFPDVFIVSVLSYAPIF